MEKKKITYWLTVYSLWSNLEKMYIISINFTVHWGSIWFSFIAVVCSAQEVNIQNLSCCRQLFFHPDHLIWNTFLRCFHWSHHISFSLVTVTPDVPNVLFWITSNSTPSSANQKVRVCQTDLALIGPMVNFWSVMPNYSLLISISNNSTVHSPLCSWCQSEIGRI